MAQRVESDAPADSDALSTLCAHLESAGGAPDVLMTLMWKIGGHRGLIGHWRIFIRLQKLLATDVFAEASLEWAGAWRKDLQAWRATLELLRQIEAALRADKKLDAMFREPRNERDHPLLHHGVTRHPIAAALFNHHQLEDDPQRSGDGVVERYLLAQAHVFAMYVEARARAALGRDAFLVHTGEKEFAPVPLGAGPVGLTLREFSRAEYAPILASLPVDTDTRVFARQLAALVPAPAAFAALPISSRARAARYFTDLKSYVDSLPALLNATNLEATTRKPGEPGAGGGGHEVRPGWVGFTPDGVQRQLDWEEGAPPVTLVSLPTVGEPDPNEEEADGEAPASSRDSAWETYPPKEAAREMSKMRHRQLAIEKKYQEDSWALESVGPVDRQRSMNFAQSQIDAYGASSRNRTKAKSGAIGGLLVKAAGLFGWQPEVTAGIQVLRVDALDTTMAESLCYLDHDHIKLLVTAHADDSIALSARAFLVPAVGPRYKTQLSAETESTGRLRQRAFLLPDAAGLGDDIWRIAHESGRLNETLPRRVLGVEGTTARALAVACMRAADDPLNDDPRAAVTLGRLITSVRIAITEAAGDAVPAWLIMRDVARVGEARFFYTQVAANRLGAWHRGALARLDVPTFAKEDVDTLASLQRGWVGCRNVVDLDRVRTFVGNLQCDLQVELDLECRSALRDYHNHYTLHAWLFQHLPLGLRPVMNGTSISHAVERYRANGSSAMSAPALGIVDKHNGYQDKARLMPLLEEWTTAATSLEQHNAGVIQRLYLLQSWRDLDAAGQRMFFIKDDESLAPVTPAWVRTQLARRGLPVAPNFGRGLLRTEWLDMGEPGRRIDATLGHFDHGQNPFGKHSSHDPAVHLERVGQQIRNYASHLGIHPVPSQCVPSTDRHASDPGAWLLPPLFLKDPPRQQQPRPVWFGTNLMPPLPDRLSKIWAEVRRHASEMDAPELISLLWFLRQAASGHALTLSGMCDVGAMTLDGASAQQLEDEAFLAVTRRLGPRTTAASWLRMLHAAQQRLIAQGVVLVLTKVAALTTEPTSPVSTIALQRLPDVECWRSALHAWIRLRAEEPEEDPRYWAVAIALSAVVNGMVLDKLLLSRLLEHLAFPGPRRLQLAGGKEGLAFLEFRLPSSVPGGRQLVRWFLDPITELLILQAPPFPETPDLSSTDRYLNPFLTHYRVPSDRCPGNWGTVIKGARGFWSTRVPQHVVQVAKRGTSSTSLETPCWQRFFGSSVLKSARSGAVVDPLGPEAKPLSMEDLQRAPDTAGTGDKRPVHVDRASAVAGASQSAGADIDYLTLDIRCSYPWMQQLDDVLSDRDRRDSVLAQLDALRQVAPADSFEQGALDWLMRTAAGLLKKINDPDSSEDSDPLIALRRVASTLLPRLMIECGKTWFGRMGASERRRIEGAVLHELETSTSRQDLIRGFALLRRFEPIHAAAPEPADHATDPGLAEAIDDLEDSDNDIRIDARMLSLDEYESSLAAIRISIDPPLTPEDRVDLEDMLHLGIWSLARPREYMEARIGDFQSWRDDLRLVVREYPGHTLKTPQAVRSIPLSLLAPPEVSERLRARVQRVLAARPDPESVAAGRGLLFAPPEGVAERAHHDRLLDLLRKVLRRITGDPKFRAYNLRHSGANWLYMALEGNGSDVWTQLWAAHPSMLRWLQQGDALRSRLLGSDDRTDRRAMLAITKIQGHLASATTFLHYIHLTGLLQLQAVRKLADEIPDVVFAAAARIGRASYSEQRAGGWPTVLRHARLRADWTAEDPDLQSATKKSGPQRPWMDYRQLRMLLNAHSLHQQPLTAICAHFALQPEDVERIHSEAEAFHHVVNGSVNASGVRLPEVVIPRDRMNAAERLQLDILLRNIEALARRDQDLAERGVRIHLERTNRHHGEVTFCDAGALATYARFLSACDVAANEVQIVLRRRTTACDLPGWARRALGPYGISPVKRALPDTESSDTALSRWVSLRLIDRKGQGIPNVASRAMFAAWLNLQTSPR